MIPPWTFLTVGYVVWKELANLKKLFLGLAVFGATLAPFLLMAPFLEQKYAGAIFDRQELTLGSYRHYAYYWLSNLDLGFLFLRGDAGKIFSVELFGSLLLGALPFFLLGIKRAIGKLSFYTFVLISYLSTPILYGLAGSIGFGHRLVAMIPAYVIITTLGMKVVMGWKMFLLGPMLHK